MPISYHARFVIPIAGDPIENGIVTASNGRIAAVGRTPLPDAEVVDLNDFNTTGGVALMPGLVNAHTHLEFSDLSSPLGNAETPFPDWIRAVIQHRQGQSSDATSNSSIRRGIEESLRYGITTIGDILPVRNAETMEALTADAEQGPQLTTFVEVLGLSESRKEEIARELETAKTQLQSQSTFGGAVKSRANCNGCPRPRCSIRRWRYCFVF